MQAGDTQLRTEIQGSLAALRTEMQGAQTSLRTEMQGGQTALRAETQALHAEMQGGFAATRADIDSIRTEVHALDDKLTVALELRERLVAIEAKLGTERPGRELAGLHRHRGEPLDERHGPLAVGHEPIDELP